MSLAEFAEELGLLSWDTYNGYVAAAPCNDLTNTIPLMDTISRMLKFNDPNKEGSSNGEYGKGPLGNNRRPSFGVTGKYPNARADLDWIIKCSRNLQLDSFIRIGTEKHTSLAQGGMTWCPHLEKPCDAQAAYDNVNCFLQLNGIDIAGETLLDYVQALYIAYNKEKLYNITKDGEQRSPAMEKAVISGKEYYLLCQRAFPCNKKAEHQSGTVRTIIETTIPMKAFQKISENFHVEVGKKLPQSAISFGGEQRKAFVDEMRERFKGQINQKNYVFCVEGDNTKWNECHNMDTMILMTCLAAGKYYTPAQKRLLCSTYSMWKDKTISLGKGYSFFKDGKPVTLSVKETFKMYMALKDTDPQRGLECCFSPPVLEAMRLIENYRDRFDLDNNVVAIGSQMFMGMYNATSSNVFAAVTEEVKKILWEELGVIMDIVLSSDDYVAYYAFTRKEDQEEIRRGILGCVNKAIVLSESYYMLAGINPSLKKNVVMMYPHTEYTSNAIDENGYVPYAGILTANITPACLNPGTDLRTLCASLQAASCNGIAPSAICLGVQIGCEMIRTVYHIDGHLKYPRTALGKKIKASGLPPEVLTLSLGGPCRHTYTRIAVDEMALLPIELIKEKYSWYLINILGESSPFIFEGTDSVIERSDRRRVLSSNIKRYFDAPVRCLNKNYLKAKNKSKILTMSRKLTRLVDMVNKLACFIPRHDHTTIAEALELQLQSMISLKEAAIPKVRMHLDGAANAGSSSEDEIGRPQPQGEEDIGDSSSDGVDLLSD